ncbi:hypothetical protein GCAAIG_11865 [Candidatus Electronema halotolerans]
MSWKIFLLQTFCLVCFASFAAEYASYPHEETLSFAQRQLNERLDQLEERLAQFKTPAASPPAQTVVQSPPAPVNQSDEHLIQQVAAVSQRLDILEQQKQQLWQATADLIRRQNALVRAQQKKTEADRVRDWMSGLDAEKKAQVQAAYQEEMENMENAVSVSSDSPPAPETMFRLLQESRERLKIKLKDMLTEEEYQAFLQSNEAAENLPAD